MTQQTFAKTKNQQQLVNELQLTSLSINDDMLRTAIDYCDLERLSILSVLSPTSVTIY